MFYIFIITILVQLTGTESSALNVRTTLFTPADLAKKMWNKREVALLRARMYFQGMIPPIEVTQNPDYISSLIRYIDNCYAAVNQAAVDRETATILTVATSDVFGGYLKMVALPVTKYAYYSGDIPTHEAIKLFKYYEDIKDQLGTTGKGWSEALKGIAKTHQIRGVRSDLPVPKINKPCNQLLYQTNNEQNVTLLMPSIDWKTRTMFVPMRNQPIIDLKSPQISAILKQFYQVASACDRSSGPDRKYFQGTFEDWVNDAVVPHLSDDDLYTAFKGILSLIDNPNPLTKPREIKNCNSFKNLFHNMSKEKLVILIILILELIFCIPTLLYCVMKRKRRDSKLNSSPKKSCYNLEQKKGYDKTIFYGLSSRSSSFSDTKFTTGLNYNSDKMFMKNKTNSDISTATVSRRSYSSIIHSATTAEEALSIKRSSHQKFLPSSQQSLRYKITETDEIDVSQGQTQVSKTILLPRRSSTSTAKNTSNETGDTVTLSSVLPQDKSSSRLVKKTKRLRPRHVIESLNPDTYNPYPYLENSDQKNIVKELKLEIFDDKIPLTRFNSDKTVEFMSPCGSRTHAKNSEVSYSRTMKSDKESHEKDKPRKVIEKISRQRLAKEEIVLQNRKGILKPGEERTKGSRIPKKINSPNRNFCECSAPRPKRRQPQGWQKSKIPKPGRALDDSVIHSSSPREGKLNVTL